MDLRLGIEFKRDSWKPVSITSTLAIDTMMVSIDTSMDRGH